MSKDSLLGNLRAEWDFLARKNAFHYIASLRDDWPEDEFLLSGESDVAELLDPFLYRAKFEPRNKRILEIGCGVGRMSFALGRRFGTVEAVDISPEMIQRARELQQRIGAPNIRFQVNSGQDLREYCDESADFCFSYIVFQHIPQVSVILNYIREMGRVLKPNGLFLFQVNGYWRVKLPGGRYLMWGMKATHRLRKWGIGIRPLIRFGHLDVWGGVPVSVPEIQATCSRAGLKISSVSGIGTHFMWVSGGKVKLDEPVVTTSVGAEGIPATEDEGLFIRDDPRQFAECVLWLLEQRRYLDFREPAREFVRRFYDWKAGVECMEKLYRELAQETVMTGH